MRELFEFKYKFTNDYSWESFKIKKDAQLALERQPFRRALRSGTSATTPNTVSRPFTRKP